MKLPSLDDMVVIPIPQLLMGYARNPDFEIQIKVAGVENVEDAKEELRGLMRKARHLAPGFLATRSHLVPRQRASPRQQRAARLAAPRHRIVRPRS